MLNIISNEFNLNDWGEVIQRDKTITDISKRIDNSDIYGSYFKQSKVMAFWNNRSKKNTLKGMGSRPIAFKDLVFDSFRYTEWEHKNMPLLKIFIPPGFSYMHYGAANTNVVRVNSSELDPYNFYNKYGEFTHYKNTIKDRLSMSESSELIIYGNILTDMTKNIRRY